MEISLCNSASLDAVDATTDEIAAIAGALTAYLEDVDTNTQPKLVSSKWLLVARREALRTHTAPLGGGWSR
ncbi:MAG: hypothetical protein PVSMB7_12750 [Chloroflexota bacterium]